MRHSILFEIDADASRLSSITSTHLASTWHIAQANPAPYGDKDAGLLVKALGDEIVRRWLADVPAPLYTHQSRDHDRWTLIEAQRLADAHATAEASPRACDDAPVTLSAFVSVPATTLPGGHVEPSFQVGRYLCSKGVDGLAVIDATLAPWVRINYAEACAAAAAAGFALITERQALAIAINIASVAANWTGGAVGSGSLFQGLRSGEFDSPQAGDVVPADTDEQRWFELSNGERICDAAGNAYSWVFDNVQGDGNGLVARAFAADSPSITAAPHPSLKRGVGWYPSAGTDWIGPALVRGGCWYGGDYAGVFRLGFDWPDYRYVNVGFRCTQPHSGL